MVGMTKDVLAYEPDRALFSGPEGLDLLQRFCADVHRSGTLRGAGEIILEIGYQQGNVVAQLVRDLWPEADVVVRKDYAGFDRLVLVRL
jgi:release factor glutamine methyltransferase